MKILIVNSSDIYGGAARAAFRLHKGLLKHDIDSHMLVQKKLSDEFTIHTTDSKLSRLINQHIKPYLDSLPAKLYKDKDDTLFSPSYVPFSPFVKLINKIKPDIVHLHWINTGMFRIADLKHIRAPIIWSLHDDWPFTGGCHIKWDCKKYTESCGSCPRLKSDKDNDLSRKIFNVKLKTYSHIKNLYIVGLSTWITNCARESTLFKERPIFNLPNPIDTNTFAPIAKDIAREILCIPKNKKIILFGAMDATSDINKGFVKLKTALKLINADNVELLVFGSSKPLNYDIDHLNTTFLGRIHDDVTLKLVYSAADMTLVPSLQENLSNTIMESMACGTPVVAFDTGGNSDLVTHKVNGYLAKPFSEQDLHNGIIWALDKYTSLSQKSREHIVANFSEEKVVRDYIDFYQTVINKSS